LKKSAGILLYKKTDNGIQFLLAHPGGPFWKNKDEGAWSIPKGEFDDDENALDAAKREFEEETGTSISGDFLPLNPVKLKSGKVISAWALESDFDVNILKSNLFEMEWPPKSGSMHSFPEIDRVCWFYTDGALEKINEAQRDFIREAIKKIKR
jgi:predicted NUDIX family NTP pyrophosphohydrolase